MAIAAASLNHLYEAPVLDVKSADPAGQIEVVADVIVGVACVVPLITVAVDTALHPEAFVTSTVYEPEATALWVAFVALAIAAASLNHLYEAPVLDVKSTDPAGQIEVVVDVIVGVACVVPLITVAVDIALHPEAFVTSTVYEPEATAL